MPSSLTCGQYPSSLLQQLQTFREHDFLCDVRLVTDDQLEFPAHRLILAAASSYFQELFLSKLDTQEVTTVHLRNCSGDCVQVVLQFLYTGELNLRSCDPTKVLNVARACKISPLESVLTAFAISATEDELGGEHGTKVKERKVNNYLDSENVKRKPTKILPKKATISSSSDKKPSDLLSKFCRMHSVFGCECLSYENRSSSNEDVVFSVKQQPYSKSSVSRKRATNAADDDKKYSPPSKLTTTTRGVTTTGGENAPKRIKNTGVNVDLPNAAVASMNTDDAGFAQDDLHIFSSAPLPTDDKEGWCRNKKYIKKTATGYQCAVCKKTYGRYNSVSYHVTIYHRNPPIYCDQDGCTFSTREARYIHFHKYYRHDIALPTNIDLESRRCPFCKHVSKSPAMLEKHINRHLPTGVKPTTGRAHSALAKKNSNFDAKCLKFEPKNDIDDDEKALHVCDKCTYKGRTASNLQQHKMFKHGGDLWRKNYQCTECTYSSPSQFNIVAHKRRSHNLGNKIDDKADDVYLLDEHFSDESLSDVEEKKIGFGNSYSMVTVAPPPPPPSYCSNSPNSDDVADRYSVSSGSTAATDFVTAVADLPASVVNYGVF